MRAADLTRWNRAGLKRFRYVDGNAVTYLERLRQALAEAYDPAGTGSPKWTDLVDRFPVKPGESLGEREERLLDQYADARRDHGWEILRSFARSTHVLTEYLDAYANETFIGTATQWDSIRRLLELLDAHPAPPASARTDLAIEAAETGKLGAGFAVKNAPKGKDPPAVFETRDDLQIDPALNLLHPTDWDRSQKPFRYFEVSAGEFRADFPLDPAGDAPTAGDIGVLVLAPTQGGSPVETGFGVQVSQVLNHEAYLLGEPTADGQDLETLRWRARLLAGAERVQTPRLAGGDVVILTSDHNLVAGRNSVTWTDGGGEHVAAVLAVDGDRVRLSGSDYPAEGTALYLLVRADTQTIGAADRVVLPISRGSDTVWTLGLTALADAAIATETDTDDDGHSYDVYDYTTSHAALFYVPAASDPVAIVVQAAPDQLVLAGTIDDLAQGDWIVSAGPDLQAVRIASVTEQDGDTAIETEPGLSDFAYPVHAVFAQTHRPLDHDRNEDTAFDDTARSDQVTRLFVAPDPWPDLLAVGRALIVETEGLAHAAAITAFDEVAGTIDVAPPVPGTELTDPTDAPPLLRWNTTIGANVASADHGETQTRKILGSGDATRSNQSFELQARELSFVADAQMPAGVRAAVEVYVGARQWTQVGNLRDSGPTEAHFEVRVAEDGTASIRFGDGRNGRRLPTGTDNLRVAWRKGVGEAGNLAAGELTKILRPDPLVAKVRQPVSASGGSATEGVASLRETGAPGLLTLNRAVSVVDFANLAAQHASVLQAHAYRATEAGARGETVAVVVVPSGGRMGTLAEELQDFLASHALPGVTVEVDGYTALPLSLDVALAVKSVEYDPTQVADAVRAALLAAYDLKSARLGVPLYRSQVLNHIEAVPGVEYTSAEILTAQLTGIDPAPVVGMSRTGGVRSIRPAPSQMIQYVEGSSTFTIQTEEYTS